MSKSLIAKPTISPHQKWKDEHLIFLTMSVLSNTVTFRLVFLLVFAIIALFVGFGMILVRHHHDVIVRHHHDVNHVRMEMVGLDDYFSPSFTPFDEVVYGFDGLLSA